MVDTFNVSDSAEALRLAESGEIPASVEVASSTQRIFRLNVNGVDAACKVFRQQHGDEVEREWEGLTRMRDAGLDLAPTPLARSETVVLMSWCSGQPITGPSDALRQALSAQYRIGLEPPSRVARSAPTTILARIESVSAGLDLPTTISTWLRGDEAEALRHVHLRNLVRADGNLNNMLFEDSRVRFVDFEDCGRGHWALDVAELTEHPRSRGVSDREWVEFFESFGPEPADRQHFASARRLYAVFLFIIFLSRNHDQAEVQGERAEKLLDAPRAEQAG